MRQQPQIFLSSVFDEALRAPIFARCPGRIWLEKPIREIERKGRNIEDICRDMIRASQVFVGLFDVRGGRSLAFTNVRTPVTVLEIELVQALFQRMPTFLFLLPGFEANERLRGLATLVERSRLASVYHSGHDSGDKRSAISPVLIDRIVRLIRHPSLLWLGRSYSGLIQHFRRRHNLGIEFLNLDFDLFRDPFDEQQTLRLIEAASAQTDHASRLAMLWAAVRQLCSVPFSKDEFRHWRFLWERTLGEWVRSPSAISEPTLRDAVLNAPIARSMSDPEALGSDGPTTPSPAPISEDKKILALPYSSLKTVDDLAAWASAQARANNFSAAIRALQDAIAKKPGDSDLLLRLADIQQRRGNARAVYDTISEARSKSDDDPDILMRELMASLYLPAPDSFQNAIPIAEKLTSMPGAMDEPFVWLWTAAAQGQRYRWLSENNGDVAQQTDARSKALDAVLKVTRLAPDPKSYPRALLRQLFNPEREKSPPGENDLEVFKSDPEFQAAIYPND